MINRFEDKDNSYSQSELQFYSGFEIAKLNKVSVETTPSL